MDRSAGRDFQLVLRSLEAARDERAVHKITQGRWNRRCGRTCQLAKRRSFSQFHAVRTRKGALQLPSQDLMLNGRGDAQWKMLVMDDYDGKCARTSTWNRTAKSPRKGLLELKVAVRNGNGGSSGRDWQITHRPLKFQHLHDFLRKENMEEPLT